MKEKLKLKIKTEKTKDNWTFIIMCSPVILVLLIFNYLPMFGAILAFKDFKYNKGILGSDWVGLDNFKFFFNLNDSFNITYNTIVYNIIFITIGLIFSVLVALVLYEITNKTSLKIYQTVIILPSFISWVVVGYMVYAVLNPNGGLLNTILGVFGIAPIAWYDNPKYWPFILAFANTWKLVGMNSLIYYAGLMGIDKEQYEAAAIDGANKGREMWHISLPGISNLMIILTILAIGGIFRADFGLFYNLTRDVGALRSSTDVIDTYIFRNLTTMSKGVTSAVGLYQSIVGFILIVVTNFVVKKIDNESSLF